MLDGRKAVVTGGLGLIGEAVTVALASLGARVWVVDKDAENRATREAGHREDGLDVTCEATDVSDPGEAVTLVGSLYQRLGGFDVWVNAHYPRTSDWGKRDDEMSAETWRRNIDMHLTGYCLLASEAARRMAGDRGGSVVNIASIYGVVGPDFAIYEDLDMTTPAALAKTIRHFG